MRAGDMLGRFSSNKFGVVLKNCTPDDLTMAADRFLAAVREDVVQTAHGPVAATITIGGVAAPRHARTVAEILAHAQESLDTAKAKRRGTFVPYRPNVELEALRQENVRATDKIITALNERRILLAYEPVVDNVRPPGGLPRMPHAHSPRPTAASCRPLPWCRSPSSLGWCA